MTFEPTPESQAAQERARTLARELLSSHATRIDTTREIGADVRAVLESADLDRVKRGGAPAVVAALEELAVVSAAAALTWGLGWATEGFEPAARAHARETDATGPGLKGAEPARAYAEAVIASLQPTEQDRVRTRVRQVVAAVAVGIARAAIDAAVAHLQASGNRPEGTPEEPPHWILADAATDVEAARLLMLRAAASPGEAGASADARMSVVLAIEAAAHAVDAALRIVGPAAYREGTLLERLTRDARAIGLVLGTSDQERMGLAAEILPQ
jgi:Acyl-CoA dehydrogenase, C-terminal domain